MNPKDAISSAIQQHRNELVEISHFVHEQRETNFEEYASAQRLVSSLKDHGFAVETGVAELSTAFVARYGSGSLHIGICAEYDALPRIGHACGHNIIAASAVGAGIGLRAVADELDLTISVLGTPAEEGGGGKILMLQRGVFDGIHVAMMVHPYANERDAMGSLAVTQLDVQYTGRPAHASAYPEQGINAASALALAQSGIGMLREHMVDSARVHGIVVEGGDAPNVVPAHTRGRWFVRARTLSELKSLEARIVDVFKGAALMTGCRVTIRQEAPTYSEIVTDERLASVWRDNAAALGRTSVPVSDDDSRASTDMGNVSYAIPSIHPLISIDAGGANVHEEGFAHSAINASADEAVVYGATAMAWTAADVAADAALRGELVKLSFSAADAAAQGAPYLGIGFDQAVHFSPGDI